MGVAVGEVGEGDSSGPGRGAKGAKPGGGGTQPQLRPSTRLVERPVRREVTPDGMESEFMFQSPRVLLLESGYFFVLLFFKNSTVCKAS